MSDDVFIEGYLTKNIDDTYIEIKKNSVKIFKLYNYRDIKYYIDYNFNRAYIIDIIDQNNCDNIEKNLNRVNSEIVSEFEIIYKKIFNILKIYGLKSNINDDDITSFLDKNLKSLNYNRLEIKEKFQKDIEKKFLKYIDVVLINERKKRFLSSSIRDFKILYPKARKLNREIIFNVGETNSGKTYHAMNILAKAETGYYLAPLRLLAFQGYNDLIKRGVNTSLITGEEEKLDRDASHISSTIEMLSYDSYVDVAVIDEIQMMGDSDRGWAWVSAFIGVNAKKVILTGSYEAYHAVKKIAKYLKEDLTINEYKRKSKLKFLPKSINFNNIKKNSAIITFSRKEVIKLKIELSNKFKVSIIYGNLSPEVRSEEALNFKNGKTDILIATDAIAMGLNLPIETIIFYRDNKFDGNDVRQLTSSEVKQIAGRAGRYKLYDVGYITAINKKILKNIYNLYNEKINYIKPPYFVMITTSNIELISNILKSDSLYDITKFFYENMKYLGDFKLSQKIEDIIYISKTLDEFEFDLHTKYNLSLAPLQFNSPLVMSSFIEYLEGLEKKIDINFKKITIKEKDFTLEDLLIAEDKVKELSLYLWLSFKFKNFKFYKEAHLYKDILNSYIQKLFKFEKFTKHCKSCNRKISLTFKYTICDKCYKKK